MAADFWASSHYKRWIVDRATVRRARAVDLLYVSDPVYLEYFAIYFANVITKLGKKLGLRQRVIATATVFFRRFYLKNAYCETDPFLVIAACCYVAAKAEESPVHIKTVLSEARSLFNQDMYSVKTLPTDNSKLAEMEFYLVDDLECDLTVFHPYRTLFSLCKKESELDSSATPAEEGEAGEVGGSSFSGAAGSSGNLGVGIGADDGPRYWGTGEGKLELSAGALQTAWFIINDTYRSDICLLYPPHLIAISAIYLTFILHNPTRSIITPLLSSSSTTTTPSAGSSPSTQPAEEPTKPRRSSRNASSAHSSSTPSQAEKKVQDPITFLSELSVSLPLISTISQEIISLYTLWDRYKEDAHPEAKTPATHTSHASTSTNTNISSTTSLPTPGNSIGDSGTPNTDISLRAGGDDGVDDTIQGEGGIDGTTIIMPVITPSFLSGLLTTMRELRVADVARGHAGAGHRTGTGTSFGSTSAGHGIPPGTRLGGVGSSGNHARAGVAVNKMLERTQAAG